MLQLRPFTYCLGNRCVDGFLRDPESVRRADSVAVRTVPHATVHVAMTRGTHPRPAPGEGLIDRCGRTFTTTVVADAQADVLADHDGRRDSYGVDLRASDLATTPRDASAEIAVTAADGERRTVPLTRTDVPCDEGTVHFSAPTSEGLAAAAIGVAPFTYDVVMTLDGVRYTAHAVWPRDVDAGCEPCVPLRFSPPLPRLAL